MSPEDIFYIALGAIMLYSTGHFFYIQTKQYSDRNLYEKIVTWVAIASITLVFLGTMLAE